MTLIMKQPGHEMDPRPSRHLTSEPGLGGRIKTRPADFLVEELPLYQPSGAGEHWMLFVEKNDVSHAEMMSCLRRHFGVGEQAIGFAGMKDKLAITRQHVSIHLRAEPRSLALPHERVRILWAARHGNKIRRGHLVGNRFAIRVRDVDPLKAPGALRVLRLLEQQGVPNYFGFQRFGYRRNTHLLGLALLAGDFDGAIRELLGTGGSAFPEYQRQRRELFESAEYVQAAAMWTPADRAELMVARALAAGRGAEEACRAVGMTALSFWISAAQSAVFNAVLDRRLADGTWNTLAEGDLAFKHDSRRVFRVTAEELEGGQLAQRLAAFEIAPSGPLWGPGMMRAAGPIDALELEALRSFGVDEPMIVSPAAFRSRVEGSRRSLRVRVSQIEVDGGLDEHGPYLRAAFDLPRGAYATIVLRELMKTDDPERTGEIRGVEQAE